MGVVLNREGINELLGDKAVEAYLKQVAGVVADEVERIAPRHTGRYADSIRVGEPTHDLDQLGAYTLVVPVETTDPFYHLIEWGSVHNEPYAPMRRALVNLRLDLLMWVREIPKAG